MKTVDAAIGSREGGWLEDEGDEGDEGDAAGRWGAREEPGAGGRGWGAIATLGVLLGSLLGLSLQSQQPIWVAKAKLLGLRSAGLESGGNWLSGNWLSGNWLSGN